MKPLLLTGAALSALLLSACVPTAAPPEPTRKSFEELLPNLTEAPAKSRVKAALTMVATPPPDETDRAIGTAATATPDLPVPTSAGVAGISQRLNTLREAKVFAADLDISVRGTVQTLSGPPDRAASVIVLNLLSEADRRRVTVKGSLTEKLGALNGLEYIYAGKGAFVRGPSDALNLTDDAWYVIPEARRDVIKPLFEPVDVAFSILAVPAIDQQLKPVGKRAFDDQDCDTYRAGTDEVIALQGDSNLVAAFESINTASIEALICADNNLHSLTLEITGKTGQDATQPSSIAIRLHFYDFDRVFGIEAPTDARPFPEIAQATAAPVTAAAVVTGTWPTVGKAIDVVVIPGNVAQINYGTDASIAEIYAFYVAEFGKLGYVENKDTTTQDSATLELLMEGAPDGTLILVQATVLEPGRINVNIRRERP